jgi:phytanoyl-CoA hydroxylase
MLFSVCQRQFYEDNGYLLLRGVLPLNRIEVYKQRFLDISSGKVEKQPTMLMMRDVTVAKKRQMGEQAITKLQDFQGICLLFLCSPLTAI